MNKIKIKDNTFYFENKSVNLNDLFNDDFYSINNSKSDIYKSDIFIINELYLNAIQPYIAIKQLFANEKVESINLKHANKQIKYIIEDIALKENIKYKSIWISKIIEVIKLHFIIPASAFYILFLLFKIPFSKEKFVHKEFSIIRDKKAKHKLRNFNLPKEFENLHEKNSIYRLTPKKIRFMWVFTSLKNSYKEIFKYKIFISNHIGKNSKFAINVLYAKRIVHTLLYYKLIEYHFQKNKFNTYYSGNNLDRYSVIEDQLAEKFNINTICIPHGLEYGFKLPKGFSCKKFYTTSDYAAIFLNKLYNTTKFIFDIETAIKMFKISMVKKSEETKIVFFTEPREIDVNIQILKELIPLLEKRSIQLYLKLHPFDKASNYEKFKIEYIETLEDSLINNICFARKSTTLLEALYNDSKVAAILINPKDKAIFNTFPSLKTSEISKKFNIEDLFEWIVTNYQDIHVKTK